MSNVKKVVLKQNSIMGGCSNKSGKTFLYKDRDYEVVGLENTIGYEIGEVLSKDDVRRLICKPNMKVVIR